MSDLSKECTHGKSDDEKSEMKMLSEANDKLIQEYLNVVIYASEDADRFLNLLSDDCVWYITPPGVTFKGKKTAYIVYQVRYELANSYCRRQNRSSQLVCGRGKFLYRVFSWRGHNGITCQGR